MQIFGGAKDFHRNLPKLARKKLQRKWPPKQNDCISSHVGCICLNQSTIQAPLLNLPKSPLTCPKRTK